MCAHTCVQVHVVWYKYNHISMTPLFIFGVSTLRSWLVFMDAFWVTSPPASQQKKKKKEKRKWTLTSSELKLSGLLNTKFKFYMDSFILECKCSWQSILVAFRGSAKCMQDSASSKSRLLKSVPWVSPSLPRLCISSVHQPCWSTSSLLTQQHCQLRNSAFLPPGPQAQNDLFLRQLPIDAPI